MSTTKWQNIAGSKNFFMNFELNGLKKFNNKMSLKYRKYKNNFGGIFFSAESKQTSKQTKFKNLNLKAKSKIY